MIPADILESELPFVGYAYSYPHKSAYRRLSPPVSLANVWASERRDALFLYLHVPFCEYRCGFCNLFTLANAESGLTSTYLRQMKIEAEVARRVLGNSQFARVAIGGGTPTFLSESDLAELLAIAHETLGAVEHHPPTSCEASPATLTDGKAGLLREWGVNRISLGVQTFDDRESWALGRPQRVSDVERAIAIIRRHQVPVLNLDLIYGASEQSLESWSRTVGTAIEFLPEEIYLYPLYVRQLTGLGRASATVSDNQLQAYRLARDQLLDAGYEQISLRMFRLTVSQPNDGPVYCCQNDGMVGLGCGARSYTNVLHYSTEFAVGRTGVRSILADYLKREHEAFAFAHHGFVLGSEERKRHFVIKSLLQSEGLSRIHYEEHFGSDVLHDLPQLQELEERSLAVTRDDRLCLTLLGLEKSDAIGPWLYSDRVRGLMEEFECV
jgi:oxygen-independent coproporphyrinogen III oxidase